MKESIESESLPDKKIVAHNLGMLNVDMINLLMSESIGGNAGAVEINGKRYRCGGANGYANPETGEIVVFDNIQNIRDRRIVEENIDFVLRVAIDWKIGRFIKIVDFHVRDHNTRQLADKGKLVIETAIKEWNSTHQHLIPSNPE